MIHYTESKKISRDDLKNLYSSVEWFAYTNNMEILEKAINNSLAILTAWNDNQLIGLVRVVGDGCTIIYIQDILVHPDYQNTKIGTNLMMKVLNKYKHVRQKVLLTDEEPNVRKFYEKNGFISADQGKLVAFYMPI